MLFDLLHIDDLELLLHRLHLCVDTPSFTQTEEIIRTELSLIKLYLFTSSELKQLTEKMQQFTE